MAALLQCGGYFVEKNIVERGPRDVLELDIVTTHYEGGVPFRQLFEIKSGNWGFSDIFKLLGWKTYLGPKMVDKAYFVATRLRDDANASYMYEKFNTFDIELVAVPSHRDLLDAFISMSLLKEPVVESDHALWRYSLWLEREMSKNVRSLKRCRPNLHGPVTTQNYLDLINNGTFFIGDLRHRLSAIYDAHFDHPKLAKSVAAELDDSAYDPHNPPDTDSWREAFGVDPV